MRRCPIGLRCNLGSCLARVNENRLGTGRLAALHIRRSIADHPRAVKIDVEFIAGSE
jgi:hypothetical protein